MKTSPCQRSLKKLRAEGWFCAITERWNPFAKIRQDLFGFIDVLCIRGNEILAVQTTSGPNVSARLEKIYSLPQAGYWLNTGAKLQVHGWRKIGERSERKLWEVRIVDVTVADMVSRLNSETSNE